MSTYQNKYLKYKAKYLERLHQIRVEQFKKIFN